MNQQSNPSSNGNVLVNKPPGLSSFQCVKKVRYETQVKKVGHAGTLDPFANGLLIIAVGKSFTTQINKVVDMPKTYWTSMICGVSTNTLDSYGEVTKVEPLEKMPTTEEINTVLQSFLGKQDQVPPAFSAKKIQGQRAYDLARKNIEVVLEPAKIEILEIECLKVRESKFPEIQFKISCSKGTYVRKLVEDIAAKLNTIAYTKDLIREAIGSFNLDDSLDYTNLTRDSLQEYCQLYGRN
ncbi:tRNA pseudouridine(55) synthase TruB [Candidatus Marinamargulisbacteria bacterium SCGC AAA071-K20]|nr:tRNA pseudouridine(55) synthase TruB [Candidatus Marinamargulisbacteria bacterium SCGC AAA071-K20]